MEPINLNTVQNNKMNQVTKFSKYLALSLFVALPFLGGWIGYTYAPTKEVTVEKIVYKEISEETNLVTETPPVVEKAKSMIESGEIVINSTNKTFKATVMFGFGDIRTVTGIYLSKESIYTDVLKALNETGVNADYVNTNTITIIELE